VLYLDSRESGALLSDPARVGVETLATEAAVAIENARLYRETVEKARVDQELRIAAEMQKALRPPARHRAPTFEIAAASKSSRSIGGDFFDYIELADGASGSRSATWREGPAGGGAGRRAAGDVRGVRVRRAGARRHASRASTSRCSATLSRAASRQWCTAFCGEMVG